MKEEFEIIAIDYLRGEISLDDKVVFEKFLSSNPSYQKEFEDLKLVWETSDVIIAPEPSEAMNVQFFDMLNSETEEQKKSNLNWFNQLTNSLSFLMKPQFAYGLLLLGIGLSIGYFLNSDDTRTVTNIVANDETEEVREQLVLTLLEQPSANKRLQAVNEASKLNVANQRVIKALFTTLNSDPNINVRLVAIESLAKYAETPEVRMELVKSIGLQDSPLVQIALADLMVALQEKTSIESMKELLEKPDIDTTVKQKLEESINHII